MNDSLPDESFQDFLARRFPSPDHKTKEAQQRALAYVSGFNAADPSLVGVHWLVQSMRAEEQLKGDRAFRCRNGYEELLRVFQTQISSLDVSIRTNSVVEQVRWKPGTAEIILRNGNASSTVMASQVLITLPLAVLKAHPGGTGAVQFTPSLPREKIVALDKLEMGKIIRIVLRFRRRFWEDAMPSGNENKALSDMSFLFSDDEWFPTWWTSMPERFPIITGWAPFRCAERLSGQLHSRVVQRSLQTLSKLLSVSFEDLEGLLESAHFHDWQSDPFSQGAYSYGKVGSDGAQQALAAPLEDTLFFAGEATDTTGHNGTVHGAIASGYRAAAEIMRTYAVAARESRRTPSR